MKSSQSNFNLRPPSSYLARSYLIATVKESIFVKPWRQKAISVLFSNQLLDSTLMKKAYNKEEEGKDAVRRV